ncbi:DUF1415 domain-containing protein [Aestuariibacter sp. AA17]|uniref:DUF1415 domain-containing protein n=1 Tax=Fluctibacter corallii TaxID=2984329 RepID=A0ABT3A8L7_9ALTE|nr:DUF1415 domain-containing protein [Aestuariibacter sp. AA17]MCV2885029.1 DUF1415 domain-containing protein [Aestuariibacter sp. AA17]
MMEVDEQTIITQTQRWVSDVVVDLNLCPFAKREVVRNSIRYTVETTSSSNDVLQTVLEELILLDSNDTIETTLIMLPSGFDEFDDYLELVDYAQAIVDNGGYRGIYQIATFHPNYCFADAHPSDLDNYTNKSPYPTLHIIREASIERVLKQYPDPENIPIRNMRTLEQKGEHAMKMLLASCMAAPQK